jgi:hypothetical protein
MSKLHDPHEFGQVEDRLVEASRVEALAAIARAMATEQPGVPEPPRSLLWVVMAVLLAVGAAAALLLAR